MSLLHYWYRIVKFIISGAGATSTNFAVLYVLTEHAHIYYLYSSTLAFIAAFTVSYILQKFWTFDDSNRNRPVLQFGLFLGVALLNLVINAVLLYLLVTILHIWYFGAAVAVGLGLAAVSYFLYKFIFFAKEPLPGSAKQS